MNQLSAIESLMTEGEKRRLQKIWAPRVVAHSPSNAGMDLCVMPDGEIRHYGKQDGERIYIASRDGGLSWKTCDVEDMSALCAAVRLPDGRWLLFLRAGAQLPGDGTPGVTSGDPNVPIRRILSPRAARTSKQRTTQPL